jgi:hypothetical protein
MSYPCQFGFPLQCGRHALRRTVWRWLGLGQFLRYDANGHPLHDRTDQTNEANAQPICQCLYPLCIQQLHCHLHPRALRAGWKLAPEQAYNGSHCRSLHGHNFNVLTKNGQPLSGSPIYLSTLAVNSHESYDIAFVADNPGLWMLHCHNLDHAANGMDMMLNYESVTTPYTVGMKSGNHPD